MKAWFAVALLMAATVMLGLKPVSAEPRQQLCIQNNAEIPTADVQKTAQAIQIQLDRDFSPHWAVYADIASTCDPASAAWRVFLDPGDNPRYYGYHDERNGVPFAMVYTGDQSVPWSAVMSHEVMEMLVDPGLDGKIKIVLKPDGTYVVLEICDAAQYGYPISGVIVSDFLTPDWFKTAGSGPYDFMWLIQQPFTNYNGKTYIVGPEDDPKDFDIVVLPAGLH